MRHFTSFIGAAIVCTCASLASAQQLPKLNIGDPVDLNSNGNWQPCNIAFTLPDNSHDLRCGTATIHVKADSDLLRMHVATVEPLISAATDTEVVSRMPQGESVGARYGTREPRTCDHRKSDISADDVKDLFICDSEHEFGGTLFLVSDVSLVTTSPRPYNPNQDAAKKDIDPNQPVVDLSASYNNYQCSQLPSSVMDFPGNKNCNEAKLSNAAGACYKTKAGEWHCQTYDFHPMATRTASNVHPPTLVY